MKVSTLHKLKHLENGFTLVEMMVAFALIGLVISALYSFYLYGLQTWDRSVKRMEHQQTARIALDKMIRELQYAHLVKCSIDQTGCSPDLPGEIIYFRINVAGTSTRHSFRLNDTQLHFDRRRDSNNSIRSTNVVALGITGLEFVIDEQETVLITIRVGESPNGVVLTGAVRPRNLPRSQPDGADQESGDSGDD